MRRDHPLSHDDSPHPRLRKHTSICFCNRRQVRHRGLKCRRHGPVPFAGLPMARRAILLVQVRALERPDQVLLFCRVRCLLCVLRFRLRSCVRRGHAKREKKITHRKLSSHKRPNAFTMLQASRLDSPTAISRFDKFPVLIGPPLTWVQESAVRPASLDAKTLPPQTVVLS
jgi:hypothetical protein